MWVYEIFSSGVVVGVQRVGWGVKCKIPGVRTAEIWDFFIKYVAGMFQRYLYKNLAGVQLVEEVGAEQGGKMLSCRG